MKKDKEWAQKEVDRYLSYEGVNEARNALVFAKGVIDQLDEPEVKQLERKIKELDSFNDELIRDNNQLRNELDEPEVLSQELPVIPKYVADWIEENSTGRYSWWKKIAEWESEVPYKDRKVYTWYAHCNQDTFIIAWITKHYEVEKEKLYLVSSDENSSGFWFLCKDNDGEIIIGTNKDYFKAGGKELKLTEKEIKGYDENYFPFAVKVEGDGE